ncbi:GFA family protein [uncultured Marinobacter sp.]|uniref:GFA family protein n=1 Tax=uncultured Marinobacter sp. TaxID=187379 RepID=UPI0030D77CCF
MLTGHCLCGDVQFEYQGPLGPIALCHCSQCRRAHGSAFSASAPIQKVRFRYLAGEDQVTEYESRPGKYRGFCKRCGSQLYSRLDAIPAILRLRIGAINEPLGKGPSSHVYVGSKSDWFTITDQIPQYDKTERTSDPN